MTVPVEANVLTHVAVAPVFIVSVFIVPVLTVIIAGIAEGILTTSITLALDAGKIPKL